MNFSEIRNKLLSWYRKNGRDLPWRETRDPYKIWLSEIILQQTRVNQGLPYYLSFVENYPTVDDLAIASEQEVLRLWQGLGYYSRARNLHRCSKIIVEKYNGKFPDNYKELLKLPGVGPYTAAAIASFAFGEVVPAIDGNVFRVISRLFGVEEDIMSPAGRKTFEKLSNELISTTEPDTYNQAMMEFGATQCTPKKPDCPSCPLAVGCYAREHGQQADFPVKLKKTKVTEKYYTYFVFAAGENLYMKKRQGEGIWEGLYDFYLIEQKISDDELTAQIDQAKATLNIDQHVKNYEVSETYKHILSHQKILATFVYIQLGGEQISMRPKNGFYSFEKIIELPKPVLVSTYLNDIIF